MKAWKLVFAVIVIGVFVSESVAAGCTLNIKNVWYQKDGLIQFQSTSGSGKCGSNTCAISGANGWTSETSKAAFAALLTAQTTGTPVFFQFVDNSNCEQNTVWGLGVSSFRIGGE